MHVSVFDIYVGEPVTGSNIFFGGRDASTVRMKNSTAPRPSMNSPCDLGFVLSVIWSYCVHVLLVRTKHARKGWQRRADYVINNNKRTSISILALFYLVLCVYNTLCYYHVSQPLVCTPIMSVSINIVPSSSCLHIFGDPDPL